MMTINFLKIVSSDIFNPSFLATRVLGDSCFDKLHDSLVELDINKPIHISLDGAIAMDVSFADAVFGRIASLQAHRQSKFGPVIVENANETCVMNIEAALKTRLERENIDQRQLRNCVLPLISHSNDMILLGKFEQHVSESFLLLQRHNVLTARDVVDALDLSLNASSTRLKTLYDLRLATRIEKRDEQGKLYIYHKLA